MGSICSNSNSSKKKENRLGATTSSVGGGYDSDDSEDYDYDYDNSNNDGRSFDAEDQEEDDEMRFIEVWDYVGGTSFRGFIADKELERGRVEKTLFLFFEHVAGTQLKHGYASVHPSIQHALLSFTDWFCRLMALIELATECFACDRLVICLERNAGGLRKHHTSSDAFTQLTICT